MLLFGWAFGPIFLATRRTMQKRRYQTVEYQQKPDRYQRDEGLGPGLFPGEQEPESADQSDDCQHQSNVERYDSETMH